MKLAEIENGVVLNVIVVDPSNIPAWAAGWPEAGEAGPQWTFDGVNFAPPVEPEPPATDPEEVTL